ncbi:MAG: helix-turn-helix domain-containing protein [Christensenellaceae bacterium]
MSREIGYHKTYIASQFKKYTGKTIVQTINSMRISKSLRLLRDTSHSISEIGKMAGFPPTRRWCTSLTSRSACRPPLAGKCFWTTRWITTIRNINRLPSA